ncbi:hypothetical protein VULLAG_LOCUS22846 [Vulpes lagopus]
MTVKGGPPALSPSPCPQFPGSRPLLKAALGGSGPGLSDGVSPHPTAPTPRPPPHGPHPTAGLGRFRGASAGLQKRGGQTPNPHPSPNLVSIVPGAEAQGGSLGAAPEGGVVIANPPAPLSTPGLNSSREVRQRRELPCKAGAK